MKVANVINLKTEQRAKTAFMSKNGLQMLNQNM